MYASSRDDSAAAKCTDALALALELTPQHSGYYPRRRSGHTISWKSKTTMCAQREWTGTLYTHTHHQHASNPRTLPLSPRLVEKRRRIAIESAAGWDAPIASVAGPSASRVRHVAALALASTPATTTPLPPALIVRLDRHRTTPHRAAAFTHTHTPAARKPSSVIPARHYESVSVPCAPSGVGRKATSASTRRSRRREARKRSRPLQVQVQAQVQSARKAGDALIKSRG